MSGVYIPGMEVPTQCPCKLIGVGYDLYCFAIGGIPARVKEFYECCQNGSKPSWCPIIPVQDHGRLIDADELRYEFSKYYNALAEKAFAEVDSAPTIIPADKDVV